jgi:UDPglucose 6-dehydrogenase
VVVGAEDPRATDVMTELYAPFLRTGAPIMVMDCASAELSKYAANSILATRISFMNEVANVCELVGADVDEVRRALGADRRIGPSFLFPGLGYGGSCFPKDVKALIHFANERKYEFRILKAVERVNNDQKKRLFTKAQAHFGSLRDKTVAVWGLAFKPRTDDMREAPSITLIEALLEAGAVVQAYDPEAMKTAKKAFGGRVTLAATNYDALRGADCLMIVTEWNEFRRPDFARMRRLMRAPIVFDGRNLFTPSHMSQHGFTYYSIGRH